MKSKSPCLWFLAQLKPNCGSIAQRNLARQGYTSFLPLERRTQRKNGQLKSINAPYFPGYIFVRRDADASSWRAIHSTYGISRLVSFGLKPAIVPSKVMEELMACCDSEDFIRRPTRFAEGDEVQVGHGPLASFLGKVEKLAPEERVWLLIDIMGRSTRSLIRRADIKRIGT